MIPTVVSLAFGVLFATVVTLMLVPMLYLGLVQAQQAIGNLWHDRGSKVLAS
jgi:hypothetical protein